LSNTGLETVRRDTNITKEIINNLFGGVQGISTGKQAAVI